MNEDLTKKNSDAETDQLTLILTIVKKLEKHETILTRIVDGVGRLNSRVDVLDKRLDALETRLDALEMRLDVLDTRLGVVESRLDSIEGRLQSLEKTMRRSVHNLDRGQTVLNDAILKIHISFLDVNERLEGLASQQKPTNSST